MKRFLIPYALLAGMITQAQAAEPIEGGHSFDTRCAVCHGGDGHGTQRAPSLIGYVSSHSDEEIAALIRSGVRAMPANNIAAPEMTSLLAFVHTLGAGENASLKPRRAVRLGNGQTLQGEVINESNFSLQLLAEDGWYSLASRAATSPHSMPSRARRCGIFQRTSGSAPRR